ncbi:carbohydrate ABC transporter permease [Celeribacter marinus]|uniref:Putative transport system permease ABC transporter protein n=1 Tax=Celeribacter marinus TaxID=1397108 RepID=A0A0P0ACQ4_9RHOB|nr:carbohydrate ABC transporter permease [Celeribacter marinus]ALI56199.1 putative transport system permease ABC transporter protein [Celeribacter marinus]SFK85352.1 carbohydrate ABC transporter membrane protein 2, CUT1 family [Celeribacter marinus]
MKTNATDPSGASDVTPEMIRTAQIAHDLRVAQQKRNRRARIYKHLFLIAMSVVMLYPLFWLVAASLKPENEIFNTLSLWPSEFNWDNYTKGWEALPKSFTIFYTNSTIVTVFSVIGNLLSCSFAAYAFARLQFTGKNLMFALMMMTLMIPYHVVLIPQYVLFLNLGWVDTYLPLIVPRFLASDAFFIFLMVQFFRQLPRELDEAAMIDGCSPYKIYWVIILPLSLPAMGTAAIFSLIWVWEDFLAPLIYLNDIKSYTVPLALRLFLDQEGQSAFGQMFAMSVLSLVPVIVFFVAFQKLIVRGIATSGMK